MKIIDIGISESSRKIVAEKLNAILSNEFVLYTKTLKYHWNVEGKHFGQLHALFKAQYEQIFIIIDDVAERVRSLDYMSFGTLEEFKKTTSCNEEPGVNPDDLGMIARLLTDHETIIKQLRRDLNDSLELGDEGTSDFLTAVMEQHEKMAWMLRAHLKRQ